MKERQRILKIRNLNISFKTDSGKVSAIRGVNLDLYKGETIAIVGESGSGKSVTTKAIMGILSKNGTIDSGSIEYTWEDEQTKELHSVDLLQLKEAQMQKEIRGRKIAMVFQDPMTSLNPTMTIGKQIMDYDVSLWKNKTRSLCTGSGIAGTVGITDAKKRMKNYRNQLSGGNATKNC